MIYIPQHAETGRMNKLPDTGYMLEQLLSSYPDLIYVKDSQSRLTMFNKAYASKHGWVAQDEGIGKTDFDFFSEEHARQAYDDEQRIIATGEPLIGVEEKETWSDGHVSWCSTTKIPLHDDQGRVVGILGMTRDITPLMEARLKAERYAREIRAIKELMEDDSRMAGSFQKGFSFSAYPVFPAGADPENRCIEFLHHFNQSSVVSGAYFSIQRLSDNKVAILLCDALGAGVRAALGASLIRGIMREIEPLADDPAAYLGRMNELLYPLLHPDPDRLLLDVTACYMVLDVSTGLLRMGSAAHPLPLHFRKGRPVKWLFENLVLRGPALAKDPKSRYHTIECRLVPDDTVVLFTDGLFTVQNVQKDVLGEKRLLGAAQELAGRPLDQIFRGLESVALSFSREKRFSGDVFLAGFQLRKLMEPA